VLFYFGERHVHKASNNTEKSDFQNVEFLIFSVQAAKNMPALLTVTHVAEVRGRDAGYSVAIAGPLLCMTAVGLQLQSAAPQARFVITETCMTARSVSLADCESLICESSRLLTHYATSAARNGRLLCGTTLSSLLDAQHKSPQLQVTPPLLPKTRTLAPKSVTQKETCRRRRPGSAAY